MLRIPIVLWLCMNRYVAPIVCCVKYVHCRLNCLCTVLFVGYMWLMCCMKWDRRRLPVNDAAYTNCFMVVHEQGNKEASSSSVRQSPVWPPSHITCKNELLEHFQSVYPFTSFMTFFHFSVSKPNRKRTTEITSSVAVFTYIDIYAFSRRFYPKRLQRESWSLYHNNVVAPKIASSPNMKHTLWKTK